MQKRVVQAFPTLIGLFRLPPGRAAELNPRLLELILEREKQQPGEQFSNVGGWHSAQDFFDTTDEPVGGLRGFATEAVQHMVGATGELMRSAGMPMTGAAPLRLVGWANVSRSGHYNRVHNHPSSVWSGVYYVEPGEDTSGRPQNGNLELIDPRPFTEMVPAPGNPCGQRVPVKPEAGLMALFPSWLYHFVNPYFGETPRVSVAFNAVPAR